jgi:hypothetical protein
MQIDQMIHSKTVKITNNLFINCIDSTSILLSHAKWLYTNQIESVIAQTLTDNHTIIEAIAHNEFEVVYKL